MVRVLLVPLVMISVSCHVAGCGGRGAGAAAAKRPQPGQRPTDPKQQSRIASARRGLADAMRRADLDAIVAAEADVRAALGPFAGVPEVAERRNPPGTVAPRPTAVDYRALTARMATLASGSADARANRMELRRAAFMAIGLVALVEAGLPQADAYRRQAVAELDFLLTKQADAGYFPYPADPVAPAHLQRLAGEAARRHPEAVRDGFIHLDQDGVQFDTGCCSHALAYGFRVLGEERFLAAARRAGDWAAAFPLSPNWNYNSFSVWQLATLADVTGEPRFLDAAVRLARLGVLPGLMDTGRWSDQHNARAIYHWIMVRGLVAVVRSMPPEHEHAAFICDRTRLAVEAGVQDVIGNGGGGSADAYAALVEAIDVFGPEATWERALAELGGLSPYAIGVFARRQRAGQE